MRALLFLFLSILLIIHPVSAVLPSVDDATKAGADMVQMGIDAWLKGESDRMMAYADNNTNVSNHPEQMAFFKMITYSYNPLENPAVIEVTKSTSIIFLFLFVIFVFAGMGYVMIHKHNPDAGQAIDFAFFNDKGFDVYEYVKTLGIVLLFVVFGYLVIGVLFLISEIFCELMTVTVLDSLISAPNSGVVYFFMALAYLLLSVFMAIRSLLLSIFTAMFLILIISWAFHVMRPVIMTVFIYYVTLIFMQPILISIASIGVMVIEYINSISFGIGTNQLYVGLVLILIATALILILTPATVGKLIKLGIKGAAL